MLYILRHPMMLNTYIEIFVYRFIHFLERNHCVVYYLRHKWLVGMVCLFVYPSAGLLDQTWLGVRCHPEWEFRPLLFSHSWSIQGPESTCTGHCSCCTETWPKVYMTYARFFPIWKKTSVLNIFAHCVVKLYQYIWYQQKATGTGFPVDVTYFLSDFLKMHKL